MADEWAEVAKEAAKGVPALLEKVYGDLAAPGVRKVGMALETILGLGNTILWPVTLMNERANFALRQNLENYRRKLESVPEEKIVRVAPEIGVPLAEKLAYVLDGKLAEMYVQLLAASSNSDMLEHAHPAYVSIIANLAPDEAKLLECFGGQDLPFTHAIALRPGTSFHTHLQRFILPTGVVDRLTYPQNIDAYLCNLEAQGLLHVDTDTWLGDDQYAELKRRDQDRLTALVQNAPHLRGMALEFVKGRVVCTDFGAKFHNACLQTNRATNS